MFYDSREVDVDDSLKCVLYSVVVVSDCLSPDVPLHPSNLERKKIIPSAVGNELWFLFRINLKSNRNETKTKKIPFAAAFPILLACSSRDVVSRWRMMEQRGLVLPPTEPSAGRPTGNRNKTSFLAQSSRGQ